MGSNNIDIDKLEARVKAAQGTTDAVVQDRAMRDIAYCSAGNLSKGSTSRLRSWRNKIAEAADKSIAGIVALSVAKGEPQIGHEIVSKFITLSTPVELDEHRDLVNRNPNHIPAGDLAKLLRLIIAKFDKRLARSLPVTLMIGNRKVILSPSNGKQKEVDIRNEFAAIFGTQIHEELRQRFLSYLNGPSEDEWNYIRSYTIVGGKTLWQVWCASDPEAVSSDGPRYPDSKTLLAAIREFVDFKI